MNVEKLQEAMELHLRATREHNEVLAIIVDRLHAAEERVAFLEAMLLPEAD